MDLKTVLGENYRDDMTLADVESALSGLDLVDRAEAVKGWVSKDVFDRTASDLSNAKKQLREKMTADEQDKLAREEQDKAIQDELKELRRDKAVNQQLSQLLALGYEDKLARDTAAAMVDGDFDKVYKNQRTFLEARDKVQKREQTLAGDKRPPAGNASGGTDYLKMASEAGARGDYNAQAYYLRLAQENK